MRSPEMLSELVDQLGDLKAQLTALELREKAIKSLLSAAGPGPYNGKRYRATVSQYDKETVPAADMKDKLRELGVDDRWFSRHTKVTPTTCVRVVALNSDV